MPELWTAKFGLRRTRTITLLCGAQLTSFDTLNRLCVNDQSERRTETD